MNKPIALLFSIISFSAVHAFDLSTSHSRIYHQFEKQLAEIKDETVIELSTQKYTLGVENIHLLKANENLWSNELLLSFNYLTLTWLNLVYKQNFNFSDTWQYGSALSLIGSLEIGNLSFEDENEFSLIYDEEGVAYTNTLFASLLLLENSFQLSFDLETEWSFLLNESNTLEGGLFLGPTLSYENIALGIYYVQSLEPDVSNGLDFSFGLSF
jgi:hypothetical protein